MKKTLLLSIFIIGNCLLESCCKIEDECFDLELSQIKNFNLNGNAEITQLDSLDANDYAILLEANTVDKTCFFDFSFGASLNAINCDESLLILQNKVTNLSIKSNSDISSNFLAGSELKELFKPIELKKSCLGEFNNSSDCLRDYSTFQDINSLEDAINRLMSINFYLDNPDLELLNLLSMNTTESVIQNTHQFTIVFDFENENSIELKTHEIIIR